VSDERRTVEVPIEPEQLPPHGRRTLLLFALIAVAVVGTAWIVLSQRVLKPPVRLRRPRVAVGDERPRL